MRLSADDRLGQYEILSPLGAGGMGEVYRARDIELGREVALKVLPDRLARDSDAGIRFRREAKALAALSHPNILTLFAFGSEGEMAYAVSELLEGETLAERMWHQGAAAWRDVLDIGLSVSEGLAAAHAKGITHRDIKPANLFITSQGVVQILDFGLASSTGFEPAKVDDESFAVTATGVILGTVGYMSPEQAKGGTAVPASDVFSLGCVLYEMLTGVRPFARPTQAETLAAILSETPAPLVAANSIPRELRRIVLHALEKEPSSRYPTAANLRDELAALRDSLAEKEAGSLWGVVRRPRIGVPLLLGSVLLSIFGVSSFRRAAERQWARQEALPEVVRLIEADKYAAAFDLAREAERVVPDDPLLASLWNAMSNTVSVETDPPGAEVFYRQNAATEAEWLSLGLSPIIDRRLPLGGIRLRIEKEGFESREILSALSYPQTDGTFTSLPTFSTPAERNRFSLLLDPAGSVPAGMVAVDGGEYSAVLRGVSLPSVTLEPFFIDRTEVTNAQFKEFVDAEGYHRPEFWQSELRKEGVAFSWDEAVIEFVDTTGRPGPATWELGDYPEGEGDYPVGGVSWYEADAYAAFRGCSLPTVYHWSRAALPGNENVLPLSQHIIPLSNFGSESVAAVGSFPGIGVSGAADLAGNVREWCWNATGDRFRLILGGAWSDPTYTFTETTPCEPFDRSPINGFRCMQERSGDSPRELKLAVRMSSGDFSSLKPLSDLEFAKYEGQFDYGQAPLNPVLESTDDTAGDWRRESVSIDAAYASERFTIHLDLPRQGSPPYQAVVYFPGSNAFEQPTFEAAYWENFDYITKSGRVLVRPILAGMYERIDSDRVFMERLPRMIKDLARTLDYLESRDDIDADKVAYLGLSYGAWIAPITLTAEDRYKAAVLISGGLGDLTAPFAHRVTTPVLMLGGRFDYLCPVETHQQGMLDLFKTTAEHKRLVVYDTGHLPLPRGKMIREILGWLDRYLGESAPSARAPGPE